MKKVLTLVIFCCIAQLVSAQLTVSIITQMPITCNAACNGSATASATGGTPPYSYVWMPGNITSPTASGLCAGTYTCTVTDALSASATVTLTFINPPAFSASPTSTNPCTSMCNGTVSANPSGGTAPYSDSWSPAISNTSAVCAGSYTVTVTDANGCTAQGTVNLTNQPNPTVTAGPPASSICAGNPVTLTASGAMTYVWAPGALTSASVIVTPASSVTYTVTGTAPNGCTGTATATVNVSSPSVGGTVSGSTSTCSTTNNGTLTLSGHTGSVIRWEMSIDGGLTWINIANVSTSQSFSNLSTTTIYRARVQNGACSSAYSSTATVTVYPAAAVTTSEIPATCNGNGTVMCTPTSGPGPFTYLWMPANFTTQSAFVSGNQSYTVIVTDANGCTAQGVQFLSDSCDYVWPGDANDDAVADNIDILDIGIANGATGTTRANATTSWIGQPSAAWGQTLLSGTDYKWVDCNGDGTIDPTDTLAVVQNFGMTHNNRYMAPVYSAAAPDLSVSFDQDSIGGGNTGTMTLSLGDTSNPATGVYGLAFRLNYDAAQLATPSFGFTGASSWMGTAGNDMLHVILHPNAAMGYVDIAITRLDQQNISGSGTIGQIYFTATTALNGSGNSVVVPLTISNVVLINSAEAALSVNAIGDTVVVGDDGIILTQTESSVNAASVYPNPAQDHVNILLGDEYAGRNATVVLRDLSGREISTMNSNGNTALSLNTGSCSAGIYFISIITPESETITKQIIISEK